jgi:DNA invertase Pin-like site-specific DNA recombinase
VRWRGGGTRAGRKTHHPGRPRRVRARLIKARTDVGIKRAREAGIRFGRPPKLTRHQQEQALKLLDRGEPQSAVARLLNVDQSTISRLASRVAA